jgi:hypothetical protein
MFTVNYGNLNPVPEPVGYTGPTTSYPAAGSCGNTFCEQYMLNMRSKQMTLLGGGDTDSAEYYFYAPNMRNWLADPAATERPSYEYELDGTTKPILRPSNGNRGDCPVAIDTDCLHLTSMGYIAASTTGDGIHDGSLQL